MQPSLPSGRWGSVVDCRSLIFLFWIIPCSVFRGPGGGGGDRCIGPKSTFSSLRRFYLPPPTICKNYFSQTLFWFYFCPLLQLTCPFNYNFPFILCHSSFVFPISSLCCSYANVFPPNYIGWYSATNFLYTVYRYTVQPLRGGGGGSSLYVRASVNI
jgi:hypothetical protein